MANVQIGSRGVGSGSPVFMVAEAGVNHNGRLELALELVNAAARAGADAVKFQVYKAERLMTRTAPKAEYQRRPTGEEETQFELIKQLELSQEDFRQVSTLAKEERIEFLATPFDEESADFLEELEVPAYKIGSGDLTHHPLLAYVARKGRPMILSTGMATLEEVEGAVGIVHRYGAPPLVLLHCVSSYPAPYDEVNLRAMQTLMETFDVPVGLSDHTLGTEVACAAVALGASAIEKHITLDRRMPGPDHQASLEPDELTALVQRIRHIEVALGDGIKRPMPSETDVRRVARRSLVALRDISAGETLTREVIGVKRPGDGVEPGQLDQLVGKRAKRDIGEDEILRWEMVERGEGT